MILSDEDKKQLRQLYADMLDVSSRRYERPKSRDYPLPMTKDGICYQDINQTMFYKIIGWREFQSKMKMRDIIPIIDDALGFNEPIADQAKYDPDFFAVPMPQKHSSIAIFCKNERTIFTIAEAQQIIDTLSGAMRIIKGEHPSQRTEER